MLLCSSVRLSVYLSVTLVNYIYIYIHILLNKMMSIPIKTVSKQLIELFFGRKVGLFSASATLCYNGFRVPPEKNKGTLPAGLTVLKHQNFVVFRLFLTPQMLSNVNPLQGLLMMIVSGHLRLQRLIVTVAFPISQNIVANLHTESTWEIFNDTERRAVSLRQLSFLLERICF